MHVRCGAPLAPCGHPPYGASPSGTSTTWPTHAAHTDLTRRPRFRLSAPVISRTARRRAAGRHFDPWQGRRVHDLLLADDAVAVQEVGGHRIDLVGHEGAGVIE